MHQKRSFGGNGSPEGMAHRISLRASWVVYQASDPAPPDERLPLILSAMLQKDLLEHPSVEPRLVLPVVRGGNTVAIHLWYVDHATT